MNRTFALALIATAALATPLAAQTVVAVSTSAGQVIAAGSNNMTLYTFDQDAPNQSNCYDSCASAWPPYLASGNASAGGGLSLISRRDGSRQWAMNGQPLYFWQGDRNPGDATGDGVGGVWHVISN